MFPEMRSTTSFRVSRIKELIVLLNLTTRSELTRSLVLDRGI